MSVAEKLPISKNEKSEANKGEVSFINDYLSREIIIFHV